MIEVQGATKTYRLGRSTVTALHGVDLQIERGEFAAIAGPSGSGKSTLLNLIGGLEKPSSGQVIIDGVDVHALSPNAQADWRARHLGFVFQTFNLLPVLTAFENIEYPLFLQKISAEERGLRVRDLLKAVGLQEWAHHRPDELSGGQRQRVAVARALVASPKMVLADEPTANLDVTTGLEIVDLMKRLNEEKGVTFVFSTHDPKILAQAQRVVHLSAGRVEEN